MTIKWFFTQAAGLSLVLSASAIAEEIPLGTTVNTVNRGVIIYDVDDNGTVSMAREDFERLGIHIATDGARVDLRLLAPTVDYTLDLDQLTLTVTAAPSVLSDSKISLSKKQNQTALAQIAPLRQHNSFYANYGVSVTHNENKEPEPDEKRETTTVFLPLETAWRSKGFLLHNSMNAYYSSEEEESELDRHTTAIEIDNADVGYRVTLGDYNINGNALTGGGRFAGVKIGTSDDFNAGVSRTLGRSLKGVLETPSEIEVYIGDQLVSRSQLPAGRFELDGLPTSSVTRDARIVITDVHGRQRSFSEIIYGSASLLRKGDREYAYSLGVERQDFGGLGEYADDPTFTAQYRYGASERTTIGFSAEANRDVAVVSAALDGANRRQDSYQITLAGSQVNDGEAGWAADALYNFQAHPVSIFLGASAVSEHYANLATDLTTVDDDRTKYTGNIGLGFALKKGTFNVDLGYTETWGGSRSYNAGTSISYPVGPVLLELGGLASQVDDEDMTWNAFARFRYQFKGGDQLFADFDLDQADAMAASLYYEGTHLGGEEAPWRVGVLHAGEADGEGSQTYFADVGTFGRYGEVDLNASVAEDSNRYSLRYSGGFGKAKGVSAFGRPVGNAFAVVTAENVPYKTGGLRLEGSGGNVVVKNRETALVSNITAYSPSVIKAVPVNEQLAYVLKPDSQTIGVAKGGGRAIKFRMEKETYVEGTMFKRSAGAEPLMINRADMTVEVNGKTIEGIIGDGGYFYLENIPTGSHAAIVKFKGKDCRTQIDVPAGADFYVSLGEVFCEIN